MINQVGAQGVLSVLCIADLMLSRTETATQNLDIELTYSCSNSVSRLVHISMGEGVLANGCAATKLLL